jgi:hypothetical protein
MRHKIHLEKSQYCEFGSSVLRADQTNQEWMCKTIKKFHQGTYLDFM